ncbi:coiled-coil domain-containing protein 150-like isoform X1 [Tubulanus polymorphus]|uniref:coiled-coil domain-containing protein 150-like isoform X1 n=1 Tax=Tubulanus polymorphus TaxID=672921 RepID=UPI003DA3F64B
MAANFDELQTSGRQTIPPLPPTQKYPTEETITVLQNRLKGAEHSVRSLSDQLEEIGFPMHDVPQSEIPQKLSPIKNKPVVSPLKARFADRDVLVENYEQLVSRTCRLESTIATIKLNFCQLQAERDLTRKERMSVNEKITVALDIYEKEMQKLKSALDLAGVTNKDLFESRNSIESEMLTMKAELMNLKNEKGTFDERIDSLQNGKEKLTRQVSALKEQLNNEEKFRISLEESQKSLLERVQTVEEERDKINNEVICLRNECTGFKKESIIANETTKREAQLREKAEQTMVEILKDATDKNEELNTLQNDNRMLLSEVTKMKGLYQELNKQLEEMQTTLEEKQATFVKLDTENKTLQEALKGSSEQTGKLVRDYENRLTEEREKFLQEFDKQGRVIELTEKLRHLTKDKQLVEQRNEQLKNQLDELRAKIDENGAEFTKSQRNATDELTQLKQQIELMENEKIRALQSKDELLDEVNKTVEDKSEQYSQLENELLQARTEIKAITSSKMQLEEEYKRLEARLLTVEQQAGKHKQVDIAFTEMMEQKNRLAYDKGRLETRVDQLQAEIQTLSFKQNDFVQLQKTKDAIETKFEKAQDELRKSQMQTQKLESQLKQSHSSGEMKERDFALALQSRDDAIKQINHLQHQLQTAEDREKNKIQNLTKSLELAQDDGQKIASTLESVMCSHSKLQSSVEKLQTQLGQKDSEIAQLKFDRGQNQSSLTQMRKQFEDLQKKYSDIETMESREIGPLRDALEQARQDNTKMAGTLESLLQTNDQLRSSVDHLHDDLEQKTYLMEQFKTSREQLENENKREIQQYEERLTNLKERLEKDRKESLKKSSKELNDMKRQNESLTTKNGELSRTNTDLRHRLTELEYQIKDLKVKLGAQRAQIETGIKTKKQYDELVQKFQKVHVDLDNLDKAKDTYVRKNQEQAKTIENFLSEITMLRAELSTLSRTAVETGSLLQQNERELELERRENEDLARKLQSSKHREIELQKLSKQMEAKLHQAGQESNKILNSVQDAQDWFKTKFYNLQHELDKSRQAHDELEKKTIKQKIEIFHEKDKAKEVAEKAREMLRTSRLTISKLADYAELTKDETKHKMEDMYHKLEMKEQESFIQQQNLQQYIQENSIRHAEEMSKSFDEYRSSTPVENDALYRSLLAHDDDVVYSMLNSDE